MVRILQRLRIWLLAAVVCGLLGPTNHLWAEPTAALTPRQLMASRLTLLVRTSLMGSDEVREDQLTRARILLDMAVELDGEAAELWRLRSELAELTDDEATRIKSLQAYVKLRGDDDVMQLELLLALISREQTLDGRLEKVERILRSRSVQRLSEPLRSRLATYAATAAIELGDDQRFIHWLKQALVLDSANTEAARLMYDLTINSQASSLQVGSAAIALVRAAPIDASARRDLATMLLRQAAYNQAATQFDVAGHVTTDPPDETTMLMWVTSLACASRTDDAMELLWQYQQLLAVLAAREAAEAAQDQTEPQADPEAAPVVEILPTELELLRLAIYSQSQDIGAVENAAMSFDRLIQTLQAAAQAGDEKAVLDDLWICAVFNRDIDRIEAAMAQQDADDPLVQRARGFLAISRKQTAEALAILEPLADTDNMARYGLALLAGTHDAKVRALQAVIYAKPTGLAALLAARHLTALGADIKPTPIGQSLVKLMDRQWFKLWDMDLAMDRWLDVRLTVEPSRTAFMQPMHARLTLRNATILPLSMGPEQPLPAQAMVTIAASIGGQSTGPLPPTIIPLDRRLTLAPDQTLTLDVRLEHTYLSEVVWTNPTTTIGYDVIAIVDPRAQAYGFAPGLLGAKKTARAMQAVGVQLSDANINYWLSQVNQPISTTQMKALACLIGPAHGMVEVEDMSEQLALFKSVINENYPKYDAIRQAWVVSLLRIGQPVFERVIGMAQRSDDPLVRLVYLATHAAGPDDPSVVAAMRSDDQLIREFATALAEGLVFDAEAAARAEAAAAKLAEQEAAGQ